MKEASFTIYNASAGSGKTFTLVKTYLSIVLSHNYPDAFKHVLAITFTNKAVGEMKQRIIENLSDFAANDTVAETNYMFRVLCKELQLSPEQLRNKAAQVLKKILHNYAFFDVSTIDKFNHRLIRTFAFDLNLPQNFEVALETDLLLKEAVDNLIANAGTDPLLTQVLTEFVLEKVDDDKSWDIARDILEASAKIVQENHFKPLAKLKDKSVEDFRVLQKVLKKEMYQLETSIKEVAQGVLNAITSAGLEYSDFSRGTLPNHFLKHTEGSYPAGGPYGTKLEENLQTGKGLYPSKLEKHKVAAIETLLPEVQHCFHKIKEAYYHLKYLQNLYKNLVPLTVINSVQQELQKIKEDENLVLISEFNATISETIAGQPAPFIYERLGEKFRHYFIDEFQDTSEMQWNNLIPLIDNALSGETLGGRQGSLLLVGDAKQAIYRWRGGNPEQFINLFNLKEKPFVIPATLQNLETNYRSYDEVIRFNNQFFEFAKDSLQNNVHQELYKLGTQKINDKTGGLVSILFTEAQEEQNNEEAYVHATLQTLQSIHTTGYPYKDIAILTRTNRQGVLIANALAEAGIPIVSSETLLLENNPKIGFLNNLIKFGLYPDNSELKGQLLMYLALNNKTESAHTFISNRLGLPNEEAFAVYGFSLAIFLQKPFYEAILYAIVQFQLADASDAYLQYYLDKIVDFTQSHKEGFAAFISYWDEKGSKLSLVAPEGINAVNLYTIHRSKGLEFPVVIYPFADDKLTDSRSQVWVETNPDECNGFETLLANVTKEFAEYSPYTARLKEETEAKNILDSLNVIYVAFTRAVCQLHIISTSEARENQLSGLLKSFTETKQAKTENNTVLFGTNTYIPSKEKETGTVTQEIPFGTGTRKKQWNIVTNNGMLWDTRQQQAIEKGNLVHKIMAKVKTEKDIAFALNEAITQGIIAENEIQEIEQAIQSIIQHPELKEFYSDEVYTIYTEKEIITQQGAILIPDRLLLNNHTAIIIDYKTGDPDMRYVQQLHLYANALREMQFREVKMLLVYIFPTIHIQYC